MREAVVTPGTHNCYQVVTEAPEVIAKAASDAPSADDTPDDAPKIEIPEDGELSDMSYKSLKQLFNQINDKADIASRRDAIAFLRNVAGRPSVE